MSSRSTRQVTRLAATAMLAAMPVALGASASDASPIYHSTLVVAGAWDSRVGQDGSYYVTGTAPLGGMASTPGAYVEPGSNGEGAFLTAYDPTGRVSWQLTFGGQVRTQGDRVAVGRDGSVYVAGDVNQPEGFPTTPGALSRHYQGVEGDIFLARFSADGSRLVYSTLLPGVFSANDLEVDDQGRAVLTGSAYDDLPASSDALQPTPPSPQETASYALEVRPDGSAYRWATYLPGNDEAKAMQVEPGPDGTVVVGGQTRSSNFPTTPGAVDDATSGTDVFVSELSADGTSLLASARFGGHQETDERISGLAVAHGAVWATGISDATDFPTTQNAWFPTRPAGYRQPPMWVARLPLSLAAFDFSTYLPARGGEVHPAPDGKAVIEVGDNPSTGFPRPGDDLVSAFLYLNPDGSLSDVLEPSLTPRDFDVDRAGTIYTMSYASQTQRGLVRGSGERHHAVLGRYAHCTVTGTRGDDVLRGTRGPDVICGRGGDDVIVGGGSYDVLRGGAGADVLRGGRGVDVLDGGAGHDVLSGSSRRDLVAGGAGADRLRGGAGPDLLRGGAGRDAIDGGAGDDRCRDPQTSTRYRLCENRPH
jgi:RTX calcium-binding nonapeptide repeat (4 copies)